MYMSTIHSSISSVLYYNLLEYQDNISYDVLKIDYNPTNITDILTFSLIYFIIDTFLVKEIKYKIHHVITLCAIGPTMYYKQNVMLGIEYLFYAEVSIALYNYLCYLDISKINIKYPTYNKVVMILHWLLMIYSRGYHLARISYVYIRYIERDILFYILMGVQFLIYIPSVQWIINRRLEIFT